MKKQSKQTLKEIAELAKVSQSMVSLILNGKGRASEKVRNKVLILLEKNGYRPKFARSPFYYLVDLSRIEASGKTTIVMEQLSGMQQTFDNADLSLQVEFLIQSDYGKKNNTLSQLKKIIDRKPSGILINSDSSYLNEACILFTKHKIPFVQLGYDIEIPNYNAVVTDSFSGAYIATSHLLKRGHKRIAIVQWLINEARINSKKKYAGFQAALSDAEIDVDMKYVKSFHAGPWDDDWQPLRNQVNELLELKSPPTALFVDNSFISLSLLYPMEGDNGILPPSLKNLEMVHFEDWSLSSAQDTLSKKLFYPKMQTTLLTIDWESIGRNAAQLLINQTSNKTQKPEIIRISPTLCQVNGSKRTLITN